MAQVTTHQPGKGQLSDEQLSGALIPSYFPQRNCAWPKAVFPCATSHAWIITSLHSRLTIPKRRTAQAPARPSTHSEAAEAELDFAARTVMRQAASQE